MEHAAMPVRPIHHWSDRDATRQVFVLFHSG
jgi:hypothetical protein